MLKYVTSALWSRFAHPLLMSLFLIAAVLFAVGAVLEFLAGNPFAATYLGAEAVRSYLGVEAMHIAAAFFGVYALLTFAIGLFGYAVLYLSRTVATVRDRIEFA
jgi:Sec-independent protein secretion pathway component TatC